MLTPREQKLQLGGMTGLLVRFAWLVHSHEGTVLKVSQTYRKGVCLP